MALHAPGPLATALRDTKSNNNLMQKCVERQFFREKHCWIARRSDCAAQAARDLMTKRQFCSFAPRHLRSSKGCSPTPGRLMMRRNRNNINLWSKIPVNVVAAPSAGSSDVATTIAPNKSWSTRPVFPDLFRVASPYGREMIYGTQWRTIAVCCKVWWYFENSSFNDILKYVLTRGTPEYCKRHPMAPRHPEWEPLVQTRGRQGKFFNKSAILLHFPANMTGEEPQNVDT